MNEPKPRVVAWHGQQPIIEPARPAKTNPAATKAGQKPKSAGEPRLSKVAAGVAALFSPR